MSKRSIKRQMDVLKDRMNRIAAVEAAAAETKPAQVNNFLKGRSTFGKSTNVSIPIVKSQDIPVSVNNSETCIPNVAKPTNEIPVVVKLELPDVTPVVNGKVAGPELLNPNKSDADSWTPAIIQSKTKKKGKQTDLKGL